MARVLYLTLFSLALLTTLYAQTVQSLSSAEKIGLPQAEEGSEWEQSGSPRAVEVDRNEEDDDSCAYSDDETLESHSGLRRRCISGKRRNLFRLPWSKTESQHSEEASSSTESLLVAEQQLHLINLQMISQIQNPTEKAEAEAVESGRRRQQELALRQV